MRFLKKILKYFCYLLLIPFSYLLISLILTGITVNEDKRDVNLSHGIFLNTNGVHLDVVFPVHNLNEALLNGLNITDELYVSFGWGDENFYLNTPTWGDLTFKNGFKALFLKSTTLIHLTKYKRRDNSWVMVKLSENQLKELNQYILKTFKNNTDGSKIILEGKGHAVNDAFYKANGSYSCFNTCNSWVNSAFKTSGLKSCYWTPFDFGLINKYKD